MESVGNSFQTTFLLLFEFYSTHQHLLLFCPVLTSNHFFSFSEHFNNWPLQFLPLSNVTSKSMWNAIQYVGSHLLDLIFNKFLLSSTLDTTRMVLSLTSTSSETVSLLKMTTRCNFRGAVVKTYNYLNPVITTSHPSCVLAQVLCNMLNNGPQRF